MDTADMNARGKRIFVVEDDTDIQSVLVEALTGEGYDASGYGSASAALAAIVRWPPDLLITDLAMPGMRGEELVLRVRGYARSGALPAELADLPILILSATANTRSVMQLPIQGFIGKPFELPDLLAQVARWVHSPDADTAAATISAANPARHTP